MVERVMILDAVLGDRRCWWLNPECDKRVFFDLTQQTGLRPEDYPHIAFGARRAKMIRCFPDKVPTATDGSLLVQAGVTWRVVPSESGAVAVRGWVVTSVDYAVALAMHKAPLSEKLTLRRTNGSGLANPRPPLGVNKYLAERGDARVKNWAELGCERKMEDRDRRTLGVAACHRSPKSTCALQSTSARR